MLVLLISCESDKCFYGSGKEITTVLNSDSFDVISVHGIFDVELVQDTCYYVEGIGGENIIENIEASVEKDSLLLYNHNSCFWLHGYKRPLVRVHCHNLTRVDVFQASYIFSTDSITDNLYITFQTMMAEADILVNNNQVFSYVHHTTSGRYKFRGKTKELIFTGFYTSVFDASELEAKKAVIQNYSTVDYKIWATEKLNVGIFNRGNIYYKGTPEIIIDTLTSTGNVFKSE